MCGLLHDTNVSKEGRHQELRQSQIKKESCSFENGFCHPKLYKSMESS